MGGSVGPGPGHYGLPTTFGYEHHDPRRERKPMFSMRGRHTINIASVGPGPAGAYEVSKLTQHGRAHNQEYTLRPRLQQPKQDMIPAPNAYFGNIQHDTMGPGPAANYEISKLTRTGRPHEPMYSMRSKWQPTRQDLVPGPQTYHPPMNKERAPAYSFGLWLEALNKTKVPGPNEYQTDMRAVRPRAPCYSMRPLTKGTNTSYGPGPAGYGLPSRDLTHKRSPNYTMRNPFGTIGDRTPRPGPAQYGLMDRLVGKSAPSYSFGIRHADWTSPMIVPEDSC
ncbi:outer dense fiber protein 3-like [Anopheles darlingi]|uniref:outer dense fiber protein 3-like n=1 Tax=Anopheles darlingi TaxID=43151 RepID=UPI0021000B34|nr:outer dense fiber protein 3-like [Anopheles darlingi]